MKNQTKTSSTDILTTRLIADVVVRAELEKKLAEGKKLRVKIGMDPTAPDLHLGHAVALRLLKRFQDAGHAVVFIIGDYTARIGDPSGKSKTRPQLDTAAIEANAKTYFKQVGRVLDIKKTEVHFNGEWLSKLSLADLFRLSGKFTVASLMERDDFANRFKDHRPIGMHELLYPMMQAQDSIAIEADVEVGGTDQTFNMLAGRALQSALDLPEQTVITVPLLVGLDGEHKMSKSLGNYVGLTDKPENMYGKVMSIPDRLIMQWFELATDLPDAEVETVRQSLVSNATNPRDIKMRLAREIVRMYEGEQAAAAAEAEFVKVFQKKETPDEVKEVSVGKAKLNAVDLLLATGLSVSKSEARRLVEQKGVKVDGATIEDPTIEIAIGAKGVLVQKGKRGFVRAMK
jgi:tyrosyl-tRNA synthetase